MDRRVLGSQAALTHPARGVRTGQRSRDHPDQHRDQEDVQHDAEGQAELSAGLLPGQPEPAQEGGDENSGGQEPTRQHPSGVIAHHDRSQAAVWTGAQDADGEQQERDGGGQCHRDVSRHTVEHAGLIYVYETRVLHGVARDIPMALPTAVAFLLLSIGILCARPDRGLTAVVMSDDAGGVLARRLLPAAVLIPPFLGWLRLAGQQAGTELSLTLSIVLNILLFTVLIWVISRSLNRADITRRMGERRLATQYATVHILAQSGTLSEAMPQILEAVSTSLNWVVAIRWSVDAESNVLRCGDI